MNDVQEKAINLLTLLHAGLSDASVDSRNEIASAILNGAIGNEEAEKAIEILSHALTIEASCLVQQMKPKIENN